MKINKLFSQIYAKLKLPAVLEKEAHADMRHLRVGSIWSGWGVRHDFPEKMMS